MRFILVLASAAVPMVFTGCGQKGPLRLPPGAQSPPPVIAPAPLPPGARTPADELPPGPVKGDDKR